MKSNSQTERAARDRLIDLLGFGYTYPLSDTLVSDEFLKVAHNKSANIPIQQSQSDVIYQLHDKDEKAVKDAEGNVFEIAGNGAETLLKTELITEEVSYKIWARKIPSPVVKENVTPTKTYALYLTQTAEVRVGLDTTLSARIKSTLLDNNNSADSDARIIHYQQSFKVQIDNSQEGVDYRLFTNKNDQQTSISKVVEGLGKNKSIELIATELKEDSTLYIQAVRNFDSADAQEKEVAWLDISLPLKVRANAQLNIEPSPASIIDFNQSPSILLNNSQSSVHYQVFIHPLHDDEFVFDATEDELLSIPVSDYRDVQLKQPAQQAIWVSTPKGYTQASDWQQGNNNKLSIALNKLTVDSLVIIQAEKSHQAGDKSISSAVQLQQAAVILVRPNPIIPLSLRMPVIDNPTLSTLQVFNGQRGVFYHFRLSVDGNDISLPAYFHHWSAENQPENKGLEQLRLNVDFVITNTDNPQSPTVDFSSLADNATLHIKARKALTNVTANLAQPIKPPALSLFQNQTIEVPAQTAAEIQILQTKPEVNYQLLQDQQVISNIVPGNGATLKLTTDIIDTDSVFTVRSIHALAQGITFEIDQSITVNIKPN